MLIPYPNTTAKKPIIVTFPVFVVIFNAIDKQMVDIESGIPTDMNIYKLSWKVNWIGSDIMKYKIALLKKTV